MRRIRITGLCLVAVLAFTAMLVTSAQAGKVTLITGPWKFGVVTNPGAQQEIPGVTVTKCEGTQTSEGEVKAVNEAVTTTKFTGCASGGKKCVSKEAVEKSEKETIYTEKNLVYKLGFVNKAADEIGESVQPPSGGELLANYECEGLSIKTFGSAIESYTPINEQGTTAGATFEAKKGEHQNIREFEGGPERKEEVETNLEPGKKKLALQELTVSTITNEEAEVTGKKGVKTKVPDPTEVRTETINGITGSPKNGEVTKLANPEWGRCQPHKKGHFEANCVKEKGTEKKGKVKYSGTFEWEAA